MEFIFEIVLQFLAEIALQIFAEVLFEIGFQSLAETIKRPLTGNPSLAVIGYSLLGGAVGAFSLLLASSSFIHNPTGRLVNLAVSPVVAGLVMVLLGAWRRRRGQELVRLNHFSYGFTFAMSMALVRYQWAS